MGNKKKPTSAKSWKGKLNVAGASLDLPSENVALVRQISPQAFLTDGLIPDPLMPIVSQAINTKKGLPPQKLKQIMDDPKLVTSAMELFDRTIAYVVLEPKILMPPTCTECEEYANQPQHKEVKREDFHAYREGPRDPEILYADEVDMTDKQFVFQWALGGVRELEPFREELAAVVGPLSAGQGVPSEAVGTS
jgi:hypothetical protein